MKELNSGMLKNMLISGANAISNHKQEVNDLNVFPVPDGDTGTNMAMTILAAAAELSKSDPKSVDETAKINAQALLRGARGNSGVIVSLLFRGFSKALAGRETAKSEDIVLALKMGVEAAYKAVMKPTEGTILTVARLSAAHVEEKIKPGEDLEKLFEAMIKSAKETLEKTPDMLPVLKQAGVVDAGGKGLIIIYEGMLSCLKTGEIVKANDEREVLNTKAEFSSTQTEDIKFAYCTEFLISREKTASPDDLADYLGSIGDSLVVVDDEDIIKVHVHTNNPGLAIERALKFGALSKVKIENMKEQHSEMMALEDRAKEEVPLPPSKEYGFVAVSAGEGLASVFKDLGCDEVVEGGQTMNPSTEDLLSAILKVPAKTVFVLPNNKNIIMAAEQCIPLAGERGVAVIPTTAVTQGVAAILSFNPDGELEENFSAMNNAAGMISTVSLTFAARDSVFDGHEIKEGEILGLLENKLVAVGKDIEEIAIEALKKTDIDSKEFITIYYGADIDEEDAKKMEQRLKDELGEGREIVLIDGGQPVYYYIIAAE